MFKRKLPTYYLFGILLLLPLKINSQTLDLKDWKQTYALDSYLKIVIDETNSLSFEQIKADNHNLVFQPLIEKQEAFKAEKNYWSKFQIANYLPSTHPQTEWVLHFSLNFTDIEVYVVDNLGCVQTSKTGFFTPLSKRTFIPTVKANVVKLSLLPNKFYTIYLKAKCDRNAISADINEEFKINLFAAEKYLIDLKKHKEKDAIYYGFVLMMLIYNLILFLFTRDKAFVFYSSYLFGVLLFIAYNSGALADWLCVYLFPEQPQLIHFYKLFTYIGIIGYWTFMRTFMDLPKLLPIWNTIFKWLSFAAIIALILDAYLMIQTNYSYNVVDRVTLSFGGIFVLSIFAITIPLINTKDKKAYFIVFGIIAMGLGSLAVIWARIQTVDFSTFFLKIASVLEIIAFSLGLAYRRLLVEKERQQTHFQLIKSKLIQEQEQKEAERLKELDSLKSKLYTNITHEFRTPLTVIMGVNSQLKNNKKEKELIHRNSNSLLQLINQMLDLAKAEEGKLMLNLVNKDIINYLRYLTESFLSAAETKKIRLTFYTEEESFFMNYDERKIQHIIQNLLSNAIKFTPEYGKIIIHTKVIEIETIPCLQLTVKDSGIGISEADLPFIFDRFYQSDNSSTRKAGGTGIGLALTKELINLMEGKINVLSQIGKGSKFILQLPTNIKQDRTAVEINPPSEVIREKGIAFNKPEVLTNETSTIKSYEEFSFLKPLLLIIEDNEDVMAYLQTCLEKVYEIALAKNGRVGIEKAIEIIPDIIISDVMMPEKDGFEVTQILKQNAITSHIPIILLTAKATQENKLKGLKYGVDAYLMKPFNKEELLIRLEKLIELRNRLQKYYTERYVFFNEAITPKIHNSETIFINQLYQIINENLSEPDFSVPQIAQILNMSQIQVYRKLKALVGKTPSQYIRSIRMEKAMHLLKKTNMNISEIAYDLGFSDPNYFSRTFHKFMENHQVLFENNF